MTKIKLQKQVKSKFYSFLNLVSSVVLNSAFLCIWLAIQFAVAYLTSFFATNEIAQYWTLAFRIIITISTLRPFLEHTSIQVIQTFRDILTAAIEAYYEVRDVWRGLNDSNEKLKM